jgi:DMSO/TMAO reductase YedYZ molybdopterin-dependent catalytic subunit
VSSKIKNEKRLPPGQKPTKRILRWGTDHPGITSANPRIDTKTYTLTVDGEVDSVQDCRWEGIRFTEIEKLSKPKPTAKAATFECADGYATSLFLTELVGGDVLLAYKLNGEPLEEGLGFPLRLVVPSKYAYKSALWVTHIRFTRAKELGFWEKRGYSDTADVWKNDRFKR